MAVALYNNTREKITLKKGTIVAKVATANVIPPMLVPASGTFQNIPNFGDGLDGNGCEDGYVPSNVMDDLKLGSTSQIKHEIKLCDPKPFKDRYWRIPPQQFKEVRAHLQDMLKIGAICKSTSPWASPVVLVQKKDGSLRFCIDL